jgi:hypothetical protein
VKDHDHGHDQRKNVREAGRALEDDRVGEFNRARIATGLHAIAAGDGRDWSHEWAQR